MNSTGRCCTLFGTTLNLTSKGPSLVSSWNQIRFASKATGGNKNKKQAPGNHRGIQKNDGKYVFPGEVLVYRLPRLWFHPGLNVGLTERPYVNLVALKEGIVRVSCEKPDLNFKSNKYVKEYYSGREGQTFYKKYFNVIPKPQHTRFKCIDQV